jgi:hypothetical protein
MATTQSLDPRKSPWKRGDVCTMGFERNCFVVSHAPEYLEVRWMDDGTVEKIPAEDVDNLVRVGHSDGLGPDGQRSNLQYLHVLETLEFLERGAKDRMESVKSEREKRALGRLVRRAFTEGKCKWDERHFGELLTLLSAPQNVGFVFRIRERIHRIFCSIE